MNKMVSEIPKFIKLFSEAIIVLKDGVKVKENAIPVMTDKKFSISLLE